VFGRATSDTTIELIGVTIEPRHRGRNFYRNFYRIFYRTGRSRPERIETAQHSRLNFPRSEPHSSTSRDRRNPLGPEFKSPLAHHETLVRLGL